jgi:hypothetical protein
VRNMSIPSQEEAEGERQERKEPDEEPSRDADSDNSSDERQDRQTSALGNVQGPSCWRRPVQRGINALRAKLSADFCLMMGSTATRKCESCWVT